jgi:hypothetical protein
VLQDLPPPPQAGAGHVKAQMEEQMLLAKPPFLAVSLKFLKGKTQKSQKN